MKIFPDNKTSSWGAILNAVENHLLNRLNMTEAEIKKIIFQLLKQIAPDTEPNQLGPDDNIREKLEIDSFDSLRMIVALDEKLGVETPEQDYGKIATLKGLVDYIMEKKKEI
jgi:acyl carrier protein